MSMVLELDVQQACIVVMVRGPQAFGHIVYLGFDTGVGIFTYSDVNVLSSSVT